MACIYNYSGRKSFNTLIFESVFMFSNTACAARYTVVCVCVDCYSCSMINKVQARVSIGF